MFCIVEYTYKPPTFKVFNKHILSMDAVLNSRKISNLELLEWGSGSG